MTDPAAVWARRFNRRRLRVTPVERIRSAVEMRTIPFSVDPPARPSWAYGWWPA